MGTIAHTSRLSQLLGLMPRQLHEALDAWSYRLALKRAGARRQVAAERAKPETAGGIDYKLRPWRD